MYSVWISLWVAMWAVLIVTLPFHLLLHGIVAYRIAQQEGWNAVFRKGRYLQEIRQHRTLARMMLGWLVIAFIEICGLMVLSILVFTSRAEAASGESMRVGSIPETGDILVVGPNTLWRFDTQDYTLKPAVNFTHAQAIIGTTLAPDAIFMNVTYSVRPPDIRDPSTGIMHLSFEDGEIYEAFQQEFIFLEAISPDGRQALARYQTCSACEPTLCFLDLETANCSKIDEPDSPLVGDFRSAHWLPDDRLIAFYAGPSSAIAEYDFDDEMWKLLVEGQFADATLVPNQAAMLIHRASDIAVYDLDSGEFDVVPNIYSEVQPVLLNVSPDGKRALMATASLMTVFEIASGEVVYEQDVAIGRGEWMADSTRLVVFGDREDRIRQEYHFAPDLFRPIQVTQMNYPFTTLLIVNVETGEVERTLSLEDAPRSMILVP